MLIVNEDQVFNRNFHNQQEAIPENFTPHPLIVEAVAVMAGYGIDIRELVLDDLHFSKLNAAAEFGEEAFLECFISILPGRLRHPAREEFESMLQEFKAQA